MNGGAAETEARTSEGAPRIDPISEARALLARFHVRAAHEIEVEHMAASLGAYTIYGETGGADARVVCQGDCAFFCIARAHQGSARARFSVAPELAHFLFHRHIDDIARIHGAARVPGPPPRVEVEANRFASELLLPTDLLAPWTRLARPSFDDVSNVAAVFTTSLTATMKKWAAVASAPCAVVVSRRGKVTEVQRSHTFAGTAFLRRKLEPLSAAYAILHGAAPAARKVTRVHSAAWGGRAGKREVIEESLGVPDRGFIVTWLRHD